jgi:hypothetical protein
MASASAYPTSFPVGGGYSPTASTIGDHDEEEQDDDPRPPSKKLKESPSSKKRALGEELINQLSDTEIRDTFQGNLKKNCGKGINSNGCLLNNLAPKGDGYVQVTPMGIKKDGTRWKALFGTSARAAQKVLWHQVAWRFHNNYQVIPYTADGSAQIGHSCGKRNCGAAAHISIVDRATNEQQKRCSYVYIEDQKTQAPAFYLMCSHTPPCIPHTRKATKLTLVDQPPILVAELTAALVASSGSAAGVGASTYGTGESQSSSSPVKKDEIVLD